MESVALLTQGERSELFRSTAEKKGVTEALVEKDFWVCFVLDHLFAMAELNNILLFKGGTALSKAYGLIGRFSEDIDLILDWRALGITDEEAWEPSRSATQQDKFSSRMDALGREYIAEQIAPALGDRLTRRTEGKLTVSVSREDGHTIVVHYPRSFHSPYLLEFIKLEIGPRAARVPHAPVVLRPYAAEWYPNVFRRPTSTVKAILAERTFWEKATILHQIAFMDDAKRLPPRYSRHYYDLHMIAGTDTGHRALADLDLLADVATFKSRFYRSPRARYDLARPGSLRLLPTEVRMAALREDYARMREMIFGKVPEFGRIAQTLEELERTINGA